MDEKRKEQIRKSLDSQFDVYDGALMSGYASELLEEVEQLGKKLTQLRELEVAVTQGNHVYIYPIPAGEPDFVAKKVVIEWQWHGDNQPSWNMHCYDSFSEALGMALAHIPEVKRQKGQ
jgi:hypothetical protein